MSSSFSKRSRAHSQSAGEPPSSPLRGGPCEADSSRERRSSSRKTASHHPSSGGGGPLAEDSLCGMGSTDASFQLGHPAFPLTIPQTRGGARSPPMLRRPPAPDVAGGRCRAPSRSTIPDDVLGRPSRKL